MGRCARCTGDGSQPPRRRWTRWIPLGVLVLVVLALAFGGARAEVFHSRESALRLAFPQAETIESRQWILDETQVAAIEARSGTELDSRLLNVYVGRRGDEVLGYAFIETHRVRSLPETVMVVVGPDGRSRGVHLLAFHEPPEYRPPARWLEQFEGRALDEELALRHGIAGIAGSTLSATALTAAVRRVLATFEVCLATDPAPEPDATALR